MDKNRKKGCWIKYLISGIGIFAIGAYAQMKFDVIGIAGQAVENGREKLVDLLSKKNQVSEID